MVRPKNGVQHPDLDNAWAAYDTSVAKATESVKSAIAKQFDAAAAKGDLDAAEKWQGIGEEFESAGELPTAAEMKAAVSAAVADLRKARDELSKAYEAVVRSLTMEKKITEAKAVRTEANTVLLDRADLDDASKTSSKLTAAGRGASGLAPLTKKLNVKDDLVFRFEGVWLCEQGGWTGIRTVRGDAVICDDGPVGKWQRTDEQITVNWAKGGFIKLTLDPKNPDVLRGRNRKNEPTVWVRQKN